MTANTIMTSTTNGKPKKQRIAYLDLTKLVAIVLVVWGHILARLDVPFAVSRDMVEWIYSFHMPLFMMMSGMFVTSSLRLGFWDLVGKKFKQLIVPVITCTLISIAYFIVVRGGCDYRTELIGNSWFLKTLFVCYLIFWIVKKLPLTAKIPDYVRYPLACLVLFLVPHAYSMQVNWLFPFMVGGGNIE